MRFGTYRQGKKLGLILRLEGPPLEGEGSPCKFIGWFRTNLELQAAKIGLERGDDISELVDILDKPQLRKPKRNRFLRVLIAPPV